MLNRILNFLRVNSVTYGITVNNEAKEVKKLLDILIPLIDENDEIIVLQDVTKENADVTKTLDSYGGKIIRITSKLDGDFSTFKNNLISHATKQYLFQIDADEYPQKKLIKNLKFFLWKNFNYDCFVVPRINIVKGITESDIKNWNWNLNEKDYINFPDYQNRIFKLGKDIRWQNKIHEVLVNFKKVKKMPSNTEDYCLVHIKNIDRQRNQNAFYDTL
ncbi:glycosyltransferase [Epilithonimonas zeae]|uniref:Glycosyl transferase family 2 n=1 Tax=Epilithonimonas zeae TaxID=1416779 RepID=A0A1N6JU14_9FLAO|nr:glycosyltransferase [Epilithonimonas zeae]SIO47848.1 Glycosyl transferase family 2 [Epilithonimonas zeae]